MSLKVLVVEDEALIRFTLVEYLSADGFETLEAADADEAVHVLTSGATIDVLLSDVRMPGEMDGFALAQMVSKRWPHIKIMLLSGHAGGEVHGNLPTGVVFERKPYPLPLLADRLRTLIPQSFG